MFEARFSCVHVGGGLEMRQFVEGVTHGVGDNTVEGEGIGAGNNPAPMAWGAAGGAHALHGDDAIGDVQFGGERTRVVGEHATEKITAVVHEAVHECFAPSRNAAVKIFDGAG